MYDHAGVVPFINCTVRLDIFVYSILPNSLRYGSSFGGASSLITYKLESGHAKSRSLERLNKCNI